MHKNEKRLPLIKEQPLFGKPSESRETQGFPDFDSNTHNHLKINSASLTF
jgi:hypothetical protein